MEPTKNTTGLKIGAVVLFVVLLGVAAYFFMAQNKTQTPPPTETTTTQTQNPVAEEDSLEQISADYATVEAVDITADLSSIDKELAE